MLFTGHDLEILELEFLSLFHRLTQYFRKEAEQREAERFMMLFLDYEIQEHKDDRESFWGWLWCIVKCAFGMVTAASWTVSA